MFHPLRVVPTISWSYKQSFTIFNKTIFKQGITYYTKSHEYIKIIEEKKKEEEGKQKEKVKCKIGISTYGSGKLGEIVYIDIIRKINEQVKQGECIATVESVKSVGDIYTPISGTILNVNERLVEEVDLLNKDSEGEGWIMEISTNSIDKSEVLQLNEYKNVCEEEDRLEQETLPPEENGKK